MALIPRLHLIALGGAHQLPHFVPPALELARQGSIELVAWVPDAAAKQDLHDFSRRIGFEAPATEIMSLPPQLRLLEKPFRLDSKAAKLILNAGALRNCDVILCAERTSTLLKRLPGKCPPMIHIPHGAGDRAVGFEKRIRLFDQVLVMGPKDRARMVAAGIVQPDNCATIGPVKLASMTLINDRPVLFDNRRKTVFYNPHFDPELGSYDKLAVPIVEWFAQQQDFNLIFAPHVRLKERLAAAEIARWERLALLDHVIVDFGSRNSVDMTYTLAADLYIGDVSSQVYEFVARPRPCLFLNPQAIRWARDPNYAMWRFGEVIGDAHDLGSAIDRAFAEFSRYEATQREALLDAYGTGPEAWGTVEQASQTIARAASSLASAISRCVPSDR